MKKVAVDSVPKGSKPADRHMTCMVCSCQGKVAGVINQHSLALDVIQVLDGNNYFQSC